MVLETVELQLGTNARNALSWSQDGEIAIAAGEECHLLLPNHGDNREEQPWDKLYFLANTFSADEWPPLSVPSSTDGFFIGKEQRIPEIAALEWSPRGIARHDRCALAILTTNGHLGLWISGSEPKLPTAWTKEISVNLVTARHKGQGKDRDMITAFAWNSDIFSGGRSLQLAILTEEDVSILQVSGDGAAIEARVIANTKISLASKPLSISQVIRASHRGAHLAWYQQAEQHEQSRKKSFLLVVNMGYLEAYEFSLGEALGSRTSIACKKLKFKTPAHGPLCVSHSEALFFFGHSLRRISLEDIISWQGGEDVSPSTYTDVSGWDSVSGLSLFGSSDSDAAVVAYQPASSLSLLQLSPHEPGKHQSNEFTKLSKGEESFFARQLKLGFDNWSTNQGVNGKVRIRHHGITTYGRNNEYMGALVSYWPSEQIIYMIKASERTHLIITHRSLEAPVYGGEDIVLPWQAQPDETRRNALLESVLPLLKASPEQKQSSLLLFLHLCAQLLLRDQDGYGSIVSEFCVRYPSTSESNFLSPETISHKSDEELADAVKLIIQIHGALDASLTEKCAIPGCSQPLIFDHHDHPADAAVCTGPGHTYARCCITRVSIQEPFISKQCEVCNRTFLDEEKLKNGQQLMKTLLNAFERCPYCDGRFVG